MKSFWKALVVLMVLGTASAHAQINSSETVEKTILPQPTLPPQAMPTYEGGPEAMQREITTNLVYPAKALKKGQEGKVLVEFIIDRQGILRNPRVISSINPLLDEEALRVVTLLKAWHPGMLQGRAINVRMAIPIVFFLP